MNGQLFFNFFLKPSPTLASHPQHTISTFNIDLGSTSELNLEFILEYKTSSILQNFLTCATFFIKTVNSDEKIR